MNPSTDHIDIEQVINRAIFRLAESPEVLRQMVDLEDEMLTFDDMMRLGQFGSPKTLRHLIRMKKIPAIKIANQWRISRKNWRRAWDRLQSR